jgi:hypothetical protein
VCIECFRLARQQGLVTKQLAGDLEDEEELQEKKRDNLMKEVSCLKRLWPALQEEKKRGYRVCSSSYAAMDTS